MDLLSMLRAITLEDLLSMLRAITPCLDFATTYYDTGLFHPDLP
jgi:hypothetical protein